MHRKGYIYLVLSNVTTPYNPIKKSDDLGIRSHYREVAGLQEI